MHSQSRTTHCRHDGAIAQLVEQRTENPCVPGSIPGGTTKKQLQKCSCFFCVLVCSFTSAIKMTQHYARVLRLSRFFGSVDFSWGLFFVLEKYCLLLFKSADKWTERQKQRAAILFEEYPDIKKAYGLCHSLRMIFSKNTIKDAARLAMARWYNKVEEAGMHSFNVIAATFYEHYDEILNFYNHRSSNAMAESFNAKIKLFRANLRGVADKKFFLFRIAMLYAYPH